MATQKSLCVECQDLTKPGGSTPYDESTVIAGRENDCRGCELLTKVIEASPAKLFEAEEDGYLVSISNRSHNETGMPCALTVNIEVEPDSFSAVLTPMEGQIVAPGSKCGVVVWEVLVQLIFSDIGVENPWNLSSPFPIPLQCSTSSRDTLAAASSWMSDCLGSHQGCTGQYPPSDPPPLPSRVLDIGDETAKTVVLKEVSTAGISGLYMALSYCWGGADFIKTTTANIHSHTGGIAFSALPQLFQDFIHVARPFVRYIWIDSLCIVQDSIQDWQHEAGKMEQIYQNSYLTVAAARAQNPHATLFGSREAIVIDSVRCYYIHHLPTTSLPNSSHQPSPLFLRAWAYQERLLSPRVLYFFQNEAMFECRDSRRCECGVKPHSDNPIGGSDTLVKIRQIIGIDNERLAIQLNWRKIVMLYSSLRLTQLSDRLPALSGIANRVGQIRTAEQYMAGLWTDSLILDLLWCRDTFRPALEEEDSGRIVPWAAPSWSWASAGWGVSYMTFSAPYGPDYDIMKLYPEVVSAKCVLAGESKTGPITSGFIKLSCHMVKGRFVRPKGSPRSTNAQYLRVRDIQSLDPCDLDYVPLDTEEFYSHTDGEEYIYMSGDIYIVRMVNRQSNTWRFRDEGFLLLQLVEPSSMIEGVDNLPRDTDEKVFTRLGIYAGARFPEIAWPEERTEITII